jgi:sulfite reductase (NADPH) hemoprotein beta-component
MDDARALGRARLSFADQAEVDDFVRTLERFERGEIDAETWRRYRLVRGTYGQRQDAVQMLRVKIPQGVLTSQQIEALADVAAQYSRGFGHVTTRQNVQFHFMRLADVEPAMRLLAAAGLTTREACGNSVRNITACPFAGVSPSELFDVTPYAEALTRFLLRHPLSASLPRKFKVAFEGCPDDHAMTSINDLGWTARVDTSSGRRRLGFCLTVGGGTSIMATSGRVLLDFIPAGEIFAPAEAVLLVFHQLGDYEHRQRNRMKFLIKSLGWERFREAVLAALAEIRERGATPSLPFDPDDPPVEHPPDWARPPAPTLDGIRRAVATDRVRGPELTPRMDAWVERAARLDEWVDTNVRPQRQSGYVIASVTLPLGDVTSAQLRVLGALARSYGDGTVRLSPDQNLFLRWIEGRHVPSLFACLDAAGLATPGASTVRDVTSCPGAESCRLAVTQSRGLGRLLSGALAQRPDLAAVARSASLKISGCPNGCGQHHVATVGFQGSVRKLDGRALPQYFVMIGGHVSADGARFGRLVAKVPVRRVGDATTRLLELYRGARTSGETPDAFFARVDISQVKQCLADLESFNTEQATADDFIDLGEAQAFVPEVMDGECSV